MDICELKKCGMEFCETRQADGVLKLGNIDGGWASFALGLLARANERKERSKTKKQRREEMHNGKQ